MIFDKSRIRCLSGFKPRSELSLSFRMLLSVGLLFKVFQPQCEQKGKNEGFPKCSRGISKHFMEA